MIYQTTINGHPAILKLDRHGRTLYFDPQDADLAENARSWIHSKHQATWYAIGTHAGNTAFLHTVIASRMGIPGIVDHINGNGLNNCRWNMRASDRRRNNQNRRAVARPNARGGSSFKGVSATRKGRHCWQAVIAIKLPDRLLRLFLGRWPTQELAALAYNEAALALQDTPRLNSVGTDFSKLGEPVGARKRALESIPGLRAMVG